MTLLPARASAALLWQALAEALELAILSDRAVCEALQARPILVLFDNAEHVLEATASVVQLLLTRCPHARALVTSREPLQLPGEVLFRLQPLRSEDARALFVQRAGLALPGVELPEDALLRLCQRLEGLPLALELAAARLRVLQIEELEARLSDRFRLLQSSERRPSRHQTLQAALDGSWEQLTSREQRTLAALSLLVGSWPRSLALRLAFEEGTEELDALELLTRLVDKSWLTAHSGQYSLLETIREYLAPHQCPQDRARLLAFAREIAPWQRATDESEAVWIERMNRYRDPLRVALALAPPEDALPLATQLGDYFVLQGRWAEGIALYTTLLERTSPEHPSRAEALYFWALLEQACENIPLAEQLLEESRVLCEHRGQTALLIRVLSNLGLNARNKADSLTARRYYLQALQLCQETEQSSPEATLIRLGVLEHDQGNLPAARRYLTEAIAYGRQHRRGDSGLAVALSKLGYVERDAGARTNAETLWREALALHRTLGYIQERGNTALALSRIVADPAEAAQLRDEAREAFVAIQDHAGLQRLERLAAP
jgi:predicted ATPase